MNYQTIRNTFTELPFKKKLTVAILGLSLLLLTSGMFFWLFKPDHAVLFKQLEPGDAQRIIERLENQKIPFQVSDDGQQIWVAKTDVGKVRMMLMGHELNLGGKVGFELFDRNDFGMTDFSQKINYQRALQGELERTIGSFKEVAGARVHLVIPEKRLFENSNLPSAGVTLRLKPGAHLKPGQVAAIQQLLAASVERLQTKRITVVDEQGNPLSKRNNDDDETHFQAKQAIERYLQQKAQRMLATIYDEEPVYVSLDVTLNYDHLEKQMETFVPSSDGVTTHIKEIKHEKMEPKQPKTTDVTTEKSVQYGRIIEKQQLERGAIRHLSVSVIIPDDTTEPLRLRIENIIKNAVGFDELRGDTLSVEAIGQKKSDISVIPAMSTVPKTLPRYKATIKWGSCFLILLALALWTYDSRRKRQLLTQVKQLMEQTHARDIG